MPRNPESGSSSGDDEIIPPVDGDISEPVPEVKERIKEGEDLEGALRREFKDKYNREAPTGVNLSLRMVEYFRETIKDAHALRRVARSGSSLEEKRQAMAQYAQKRAEIDECLEYGEEFEEAYKAYRQEQGQFYEFVSSAKEINELEATLHEPAFSGLTEEEPMTAKTARRLEVVMRQSQETIAADAEQELKYLETVFKKGSKEYEEAKKDILAASKEEKPNTKKEVKEKIGELQDETKELWEDPMVRYLWQKREINGMLESFAEGDDVIETQSVVHNLNKLHEWEQQHQRTTIGGVLVGPPGVGKTTLVHHYLEQKDRSYVYLDLSEEVTRYMLYGSKAIEFRSPTEYYHQLAKDIADLDEDGLKQFIQEHQDVVKNTFSVTDKESTTVLVEQILEELEKGKQEVKENDPELSEKLSQVKVKMDQLTKTAFRRELAGQFGHLASRNGWRDGVIISALRRGDNIVFDEFNKNKNWSLLYGLMTAKPGENWYFADNDEEIKIPDDWRMYFTANIGKKHGGFQVAEALASRAAGKVMEVGYPPRSEEMKVALCSLSNSKGDFLRSPDDLAKLYVLINEVFPRMRKFTEEKTQTIPVSYRLLRDLGEKLVLYTDKKTGKPVYEATDKTFDQALYETLVESYSAYEDKTTPREIVGMTTSVGLMLDDSVGEKVSGWLGKEEYEERKKTFAERKDDFREIIKKIQGITRDVSELPMPEKRDF